MPLFSQANPVNTRFKTLNLGTQNVTTDPTGITFFKLKYKSLIRMTDVFNISEYDNLNFSDYLGFYTGYDYNNWLTAKTADGNDIYAYGIVFYDEYGDTIDAVTGDFNPPGTLTVVELSYFYYDIKNVVWGYPYNAVIYYNGLPSQVYGVSHGQPSSVQSQFINTTFTIKNNNRAFQQGYTGYN